MNLNDIIQSISQMTDEELQARIKGIRSRRDADAPVGVAKTKTGKPKKEAPLDLMSLFAAMSPEEQAQLLSNLSTQEDA